MTGFEQSDVRKTEAYSSSRDYGAPVGDTKACEGHVEARVNAKAHEDDV